MVYILFIYNLINIILYTVGATVYFVLYSKTKNSLYFWILVMFVTYILYDMVLYMADYIDVFAVYYNEEITTRPVMRSLIVMFMYAAYGFITVWSLHDQVRIVDKVIYVTFVLLLFITPLLPLSKLTFFAYFTLSQLLFYYYILRFYRGIGYITRSNWEVTHIKYFLIAIFVLNTMIIIEDFIVIFHFDIIEPFVLNINQRNISDDILSIAIAIFALLCGKRLLLEENRAITTSDDMFMLQFSKFAKKHGFTQREIEIVWLLIDGKSNQEIADTLYITSGTVKNHIHNVYQKTGVLRRSQFISMVKNFHTS